MRNETAKSHAGEADLVPSGLGRTRTTRFGFSERQEIPSIRGYFGSTVTSAVDVACEEVNSSQRFQYSPYGDTDNRLNM